MSLPVVAVRLALAASSHRDSVLRDNSRGRSEEKSDREPHIDVLIVTTVGCRVELGVGGCFV
jgi:hypothetical protein